MWAKLQINLFLAEIQSQHIRLRDDVEDKLRSLESSKATGEDLLLIAYDEVYQKAIGEQNNEKHRRTAVITALQWVSCAFRTLTVQELAFAISVQNDGTLASGMQEGLIMEFCSNLLIEDTTGSARIAHLSVRHYLEARASSDFVPEVTHHRVALTCLNLLTSSHFENREQGSTKADEPGITLVTLTGTLKVYIARHWSRHCREAKKDDILQRLVASVPVKTTTLPRRSITQEYTSISGNELSSELSKTHDLFVKFYSQVDSNITFGCAVAPIIAQFVALGGDLGAQSETGTTLLHECTRLELNDLCSLLLDCGAPVNARDTHGNAALHIAAMHQANHCAQLLLRAGADTNAANLAGQTPLHVSIAFRSQQVAEVLLSVKQSGLERDIRGDSSLHYAAAMGSSLLVESLLISGYNLHGENSNRETALALAIHACHSDVVKLLLDHGAVLNEKDIENMRNSGNSELTDLIQHRDALTT